MDLVFEILGILGAFIVLVAFFLNQLNKVTNNSLSYDLMNVIGSLSLVIYGIYNNVIPFVLLNIVWMCVSLFDVFKYFSKK